MSSFVAFVVEGLSIALPLDRVVRSVRAVAVIPLPQAPEVVCGIVNLQGDIVPVVNLRRRFGLTERELDLGDRFLIVRSSRRTLAMIVDTVAGVIECEEKDFVTVESIVTGTNYVEGVVKSPDGMVLIQDLDSFLPLNEEILLDVALTSIA